MAEHDFETLASETVYVGKIFALRTDEVSMPGGGSARREVVEHYGAVAVVALDEDRNVVLVYQYRHPLGRRLWELPAGLLDLGGEPPEVTAARELKEEVGLAAAQWRVLVDLDSTPGFSDESVRVFLATGLTDVGRPEAEHEEADLMVERVQLDEAVRRVFSGDIVNSIAVAGILAAHAMPDGDALRPVEAAWIDRPTAFGRRKGLL
ncbi:MULTISPECIES: NUDIX hydrolase [unclassified Mycolicibacterium]|uniref:NUDIX domain-containing protein n=1 Tax=unclassified Mycolicibacterium TaxID=2636767 RepID=UPI00130C65E3|nr:MULTISPECIES: NUDIX hydrolase [unclassified Mycolicibacterium]MUL85351.1 NUDIX hydrolase [Mycolicibacterium sp. CBMA 329]MUL88885.1 NUDIX hydrolase [Mycolicibacterium sp. CBMA 331]MUM01841.1 NUDIX hydrolase [Mycolicibacterium sp. CBMA 334]MUM30223.1 NUDIX hydrolase [Mycolicibacterium sp. CBMA 295]MUM40532.1 NUDIX hydrolase [Mycolicibacterium sp. CBMA 247]